MIGVPGARDDSPPGKRRGEHPLVWCRSMTSTSGAPSSDLGSVLRHWRSVRGKSQLALACDAGSTSRYVSFVETGRARPSRQMVVRLARALDIPLRERNELLLAAGFAPLYSHEPMTSETLHAVDQALTMMLAQHEPFPAVVMDRGWNLRRANDGATLLFSRLFAPAPMPVDANKRCLLYTSPSPRD